MNDNEKKLLEKRTRELVAIVEDILGYKIIGGAETVKEVIGEIGSEPTEPRRSSGQ